MQQCISRATRQLLSSTPSFTATNQSRGVSLSLRAMDEAMEHLQSNPFYNKYSSKITKVKDSHPQALVAAVSARKDEAKAEPSDAVAAAAGVRKVSSKAPQPKEPLPRASYAFAPKKKLESIMKVELLANNTKEEIFLMWQQHWQERPTISAAIPAPLYAAIKTNAALYDKFLFALPREQGYEFVLAQFAADEVHFTPLINFQAYQENAPECLAMIHYTDLADSHALVLMKGDYDKKIISGKEAQFLANQIQLYYSGRDSKKLAMVKSFHANPAQFRHMDLVRELEELDLGALGRAATAAK